MDIQSLVIEVTRKCNMKCYHCLRGNAQSKNIELKHIANLLKQVSNIGCVTFTGGEPSLNIEAINYFIKVVKKLHISVSSFYIATNGKRITIDFIKTLLELYSLCDEKEMCAVEVSNDIYHSYEAKYDETLLSGLSFYKKRNTKDNATYYLIREGRMQHNGQRDLTEHKIKDQEDFYDSDIYLNVNGEIVNGCDWSYASQKKHIIVDNVKKLSKFYYNLP